MEQISNNQIAKVYHCKEKETGINYVIKKVNMMLKRMKITNNKGEDTILKRINELAIRNTVKMVKSWKED